MMVVASKCAVHPSSHSVPTDNSEAPGKSGNMCAHLARSGTSDGRSRSHVCVDVAMRPSGILTEIGALVGRRLVWGVSNDM